MVSTAAVGEVPLFEYVLKVRGRPDETLISELNGHRVGDEVLIRNLPWLVAAIDDSGDPRVTARITLVPPGELVPGGDGRASADEPLLELVAALRQRLAELEETVYGTAPRARDAVARVRPPLP